MCAKGCLKLRDLWASIKEILTSRTRMAQNAPLLGVVVDAAEEAEDFWASP